MHQYELILIDKFPPNWGEVGNNVDFEHSEAVLIETVHFDLSRLSAAAGGTALYHASLGSPCHVSPLLLGLIANTY